MNQPEILPVFSDPPRKNDALFLFGAAAPKPWRLCYEQETVEVVYGPACRPQQEINFDNCDKDKVPVVERRGGGGVVVLAPGMVVCVVVGQRGKNENVRALHSRIHTALIAAIDPENQFKIEQKGISDLCIGDKKILGSSLYLGNDPFNFYYQSSLLVSANLTLMNRYLKAPLKEPAYREGRPHDEFCTTLKAQGWSGECRTIMEKISARFCSEFQKCPV